VSRLSAVVAVHLVGFTAMHGDVTDLTTPVTLDFITKLLDVTKASAGVAFLLVGMVTLTGHVSGFATAVAHLLSLLLRLLAVARDVTTPVAVIARILSLLTIPGDVTLFSTPIAEKVSSPAPAASPASSIGTILDPVT